MTPAGSKWGGRLRRSPALLAHLAVVAAVVALLTGADLDPRPDTADRDRCLLVRPDDSLQQLTKRWPGQRVVAQLERADDCDPGAIDALQAAVERDYMLVAVVGLGFALAVHTVRAKRRWRLAATLGGALAIAYVVCDVRENRYLDELLRLFEQGSLTEALVPNEMRWYAATKVGALVGALPLFVASLAMAIDHFMIGLEREPWGDVSTRERLARFARRWWHRMTTRGTALKPLSGPSYAVAPPAAGGLGVCASGGGVRSAAFALGAFQSLDDRDELARARWLTAVSGGSYLAAAWVTARALPGGAAAWARHSQHESHLRRHASYLAPGLGGKLWALTRFAFGFALNLGLVILALGAFFVPYGWAIDRLEDPRPATTGGTIELPRGGCVERTDGTFAVAAAGTELKVLEGSRVHLDAVAPPEIPARKERSAPEVAVTVDGEKVDVAVRPAPTTLPATSTTVGPTTTVTTAPPAGAPDAAAGSSCLVRSAPTTTSTTTSTTVVAGDTAPATSTTLLPAALRNQRLDKGWKVLLDLSRPVVLDDAYVNGCVQKATCPDDALSVVEIRRGSRLVAAPGAKLELGEDAVAIGQELATRCGRTACEKWSGHIALTILFWVVAGFAALAGLALVLTRLDGEIAFRAERWARSLVVAALAVGALVHVLPLLVVWAEGQRRSLEANLAPTAGIGSGTILVALVARVISFTGANEAAASPTKRITGFVKGLGQKVQPLLIKIAAYLAGPVLLAAIALLFATDAARFSYRPSQLTMWLAIVGVLAITLAVGDLNEWSLHPFYRERLKTAFAADPVTLACRVDPLHLLPTAPDAPELVICAAANIADTRLTAPGRPVVSWTFSRTEMGSRALRMLGDAGDGMLEPDTLPPSLAHLNSVWTAVAVSGAAFSPAMGKMTRAERMLLALGNLRLGQWYPNPRYLGAAKANDDGRRHDRAWYETHHPRPWYLVKEAVGLHRPGDPWVYVTDGGHYENLGLVELLRRRCTEILCFDAAGDSPDTFGTLADAMRLAREELGVELDIDPKLLKPDADGFSAEGTWAAVVRYPEGVQGWLVIAKLSVPKGAPFDIKDTARTLPSFPTHPTADQLYTDQKFEAYRALGAHLGDDAADLAAAIRRNLAPAPGGGGMAVPEAVAAALQARLPQEATTTTADAATAAATVAKASKASKASKVAKVSKTSKVAKASKASKVAKASKASKASKRGAPPA